MRPLMLSRQQAEDLVDLLESHPETTIHDTSSYRIAAELREQWGMCTREQEHGAIQNATE